MLMFCSSAPSDNSFQHIVLQHKMVEQGGKNVCINNRQQGIGGKYVQKRRELQTKQPGNKAKQGVGDEQDIECYMHGPGAKLCQQFIAFGYCRHPVTEAQPQAPQNYYKHNRANDGMGAKSWNVRNEAFHSGPE